MNRNFPESCDAVIKSISPDLPLRSYLEEIVLHHWAKYYNPILRCRILLHYLLYWVIQEKHPETSTGICLIIMSWEHKILFVTKEESCGCREERLQNHSIYVTLIRLQNANIRNKKHFTLYGPFLWMGFNCLKTRATSRRQLTFYH